MRVTSLINYSWAKLRDFADAVLPTLSKQQCGWLKKEDASVTVCKPGVYPKLKVRSPNICPVDHGPVCSWK